MARTVYILGSGQDGGLPQFGSRMAQDVAARIDPLAVRLGPSICVLDDDGRCFLIDVSPDIKEQESRLLRLPAYAARKPGNPFDGVLLTHAHMGHYVGLAHFGREAANTRALPVNCTEKMAAFLRDNAPWDQLVSLANVELQVSPGRQAGGVIPAGSPGLPAGAVVRTIPVPHRGEYTDTIGVSINEDVLYVPDIDDWRKWPAARDEIGKHRVCILDGTFFSRDELPGRDLNEISHPFIEDTIEFFAQEAKSRRIILTHFNHSNPVCDPASPQARRVIDAGFELAQEMMAISL
ncbi:MAG: MBL fold metallo-hydrolase [Planctomycetes bacterium]|nr:MBL fold metallo-hydrolase [Planctomycetota bacterium]